MDVPTQEVGVSLSSFNGRQNVFIKDPEHRRVEEHLHHPTQFT